MRFKTNAKFAVVQFAVVDRAMFVKFTNFVDAVDIANMKKQDEEFQGFLPDCIVD